VCSGPMFKPCKSHNCVILPLYKLDLMDAESSFLFLAGEISLVGSEKTLVLPTLGHQGVVSVHSVLDYCVCFSISVHMRGIGFCATKS